MTNLIIGRFTTSRSTERKMAGQVEITVDDVSRSWDFDWGIDLADNEELARCVAALEAAVLARVSREIDAFAAGARPR
jgi:hypothetical protein